MKEIASIIHLQKCNISKSSTVFQFLGKTTKKIYENNNITLTIGTLNFHEIELSNFFVPPEIKIMEI